MQSLLREIVEALDPLLQACDRFGILYDIGGSVASLWYGNWRRTRDVDVGLAACPDQIRTFAKLPEQDYLIDAGAWIDSFRYGRRFLFFISPHSPNLMRCLFRRRSENTQPLQGLPDHS